MAETPDRAEEFPDRTWELHRRRQLFIGQRLTPAERLRWLETTMDEMRGLLGRARRGRANHGEGPDRAR
jgi:hypothetical protein